jgi:cytochrome c
MKARDKGELIMRCFAIAALYLVVSGSATLAQDAAAGETSFRKCAPCHSVGDGAANKVGPELNGLDGRKAGTADGYNYSDANKNSGITWDEATFKDYIKDPRSKVPGTKMVFAGIKNDKELEDLWNYLKQFAANGQKK